MSVLAWLQMIPMCFSSTRPSMRIFQVTHWHISICLNQLLVFQTIQKWQKAVNYLTFLAMIELQQTFASMEGAA